MTRLVTTALSAVTMVMLGIIGMSYRRRDLADAGLTNSSAEAYNLTRVVTVDATSIVGNALPRLLMIVVVVMAIMMLLLIRS
jgi:hypothetical protein